MVNHYSHSDCMHTYRQRQEHCVFQVLLQMVPGLEKHLMEGSEDDVMRIAGMVRASLS
jgi:hypothetical protein